MYAISEGSAETAQMRCLARTTAIYTSNTCLEKVLDRELDILVK